MRLGIYFGSSGKLGRFESWAFGGGRGAHCLHSRKFMTTVMESCPRKGPALDGKLQGQAPSWELRPLHRVGLQANSSALNGWRIHCCRKIISAGDVCLRVRCVHLEGAC